MHSKTISNYPIPLSLAFKSTNLANTHTRTRIQIQTQLLLRENYLSHYILAIVSFEGFAVHAFVSRRNDTERLNGSFVQINKDNRRTTMHTL